MLDSLSSKVILHLMDIFLLQWHQQLITALGSLISCKKIGTDSLQRAHDFDSVGCSLQRKKYSPATIHLTLILIIAL